MKRKAKRAVAPGTKKINRDTNDPGSPNVQRETPNNNNKVKCIEKNALFATIRQDFETWEIDFILHHMNKNNSFGVFVTRQQIELIEMAAIYQFIKTIQCGEIGHAVVECLISKMTVYLQNK